MSLDDLILWLQRGADRGFPGAALELSGHPGVGFILARSAGGPICFYTRLEPYPRRGLLKRSLR